MQDGIEVLLEVDAFGEAVGAHEHEPAAPGGEESDAPLALGMRQPAGDRLHPNVLRERVAQVLGDVLRGVDEAAEDDGVEAVPEERLDLAHRALKLPVVRGIQRLRAARELQQPAARRFGAPFRLRAGAEVERYGIVVVALVEDGAASHLVHVLAFGRIDGGPAAQRRGGRGGARRDAAQQRERRPVPHPAPALPSLVSDRRPREARIARPLGHVLVCEGEDVVEERAVAGAEGVRGFLVPALGERGVCLEIAADVGATALHEVAGEPAADAVAFGPIELLHRQVGEIVVEQGEERSERFLVAAVRRRGDQHHVAGRIDGDAAQELVALLAAPAHPGGEGAAVRFVHDHELGAPAARSPRRGAGP